MSSSERFDFVVAGAGSRGLAAALRLQRDQPAARVAIVDAAVQPGGAVRTQRTNGFVCELGPFAFADAELQWLTLLPRPPVAIASEPAAATGWLFDGATRTPVEVSPPPRTFRTGNEELVQACRRELRATWWLQRAIASIDLGEHWQLQLGGEVATRLEATHLVVALPDPVAGRLLHRFDPALGDVASRVTSLPAAMAFFGGNRDAGSGPGGYGMAPTEDLPSALRELIFCSEVFAGRALPGRFLWRAEWHAPNADDEQALQQIEAEVRRWTGVSTPFGLRKLHRFAHDAVDGALVECRQRLRFLPTRVPQLTLA